ncbi:endocellulase [Crucibulum laeve]|uniref:Endocellulase n=1 Tax=Crucibulum laeve TaxID=68775 RepID=A0A5C3MHT7_9AGAR|nr:endocellulase [Crucibulum laeve]
MRFALALTATFLLQAVMSIAAQTISGRDSCVNGGKYSLCQNLWGSDSAIGSQESTLINAHDNTVSWSTKYFWVNNFYSVKSFAMVESHISKGMRLRAVQSMPTSWSWKYTQRSAGLRANIAYDVWLGAPSSGSAASSVSTHEVMVWISNAGSAQPLGSLAESQISIGSHKWNFWKGHRKGWGVLTFVTSVGDIHDFNTDLNQFFVYLVAKQNLSSELFIHRIQAGTEPFVGSATLVTSAYTVSVKTL